MKKNILLSGFLFIFLLNPFIFVSFSQDVIEVRIPSFFSVASGKTVSIPIEIKNLGSKEIRVFLNIFPPYYEGILAYFDKNEIILLPYSDSSVNLIVSTPFDGRDKIVTYQIFVNYDESQKVYRLNLNVIGEKGEMGVENFWINKYIFDPNESVKIAMSYKNTKDISSSIKVKIEVLKDNEVLDSYERYLNIIAKSLTNFTYNYSFTYFHKPGKYYINVYSYDDRENLISKLTFEVTLNEVKEITKDVIKETSVFSYRIIFKIKNLGNVIQRTTIEEEFPIILKPFVIFENYQPEIIGNKAVWSITLKPLEEIEITYSIIYWIPFAIILIILSSITFSLVFFVFVPKTIKRYERIEDLYKVRIVLKNNTRKKMKNVEIRDFVPLIFSITNFETLKPQITKTKDGYNLLWKIKELRPREEIIISYHIKPLMEIIGEIKLPKPKVKYVLR